MYASIWEAELPNVEHPGKLTLLVARVPGSDFNGETAKRPSSEMRIEPKFEVWMYPHDAKDRLRSASSSNQEWTP